MKLKILVDDDNKQITSQVILRKPVRYQKLGLNKFKCHIVLSGFYYHL